MAAIITSIGSIVTGAISWLTSFVGSIMATGNELLLFFVVFGFVGTGIGLIKRIIRLN